MRSVGRAFVAPLSLLLIGGFTTVAAAAGGASVRGSWLSRMLLR